MGLYPLRQDAVNETARRHARVDAVSGDLGAEACDVPGAELPGTAPPKVRTGLVVVNYESLAYTDALVSRLEQHVDDVVVVDNASTEQGLDDFASRHPDVRLVQMAENVGFGAGLNEGLRHTPAEVLVLSNPDVQIDPADLSRLVTAVQCPHVALAAPRFVLPDGGHHPSAHRRFPFVGTTMWELCRPVIALMRRLAPRWHPTLLSSTEHDQPRDVAHVIGALMVVNRDALQAVGGFDEDFFLYREETDLCRRLGSSGWRIRHEARAVAVHVLGGSTPGEGPMVSRPTFLMSHYRFIAKHAGPATARLAWALGTASCLPWLLVGPDRRAAARALRWHLQSLRGPAWVPSTT